MSVKRNIFVCEKLLITVFYNIKYYEMGASLRNKMQLRLRISQRLCTHDNQCYVEHFFFELPLFYIFSFYKEGNVESLLIFIGSQYYIFGRVLRYKPQNSL